MYIIRTLLKKALDFKFIEKVLVQYMKQLFTATFYVCVFSFAYTDNCAQLLNSDNASITGVNNTDTDFEPFMCYALPGRKIRKMLT